MPFRLSYDICRQLTVAELKIEIDHAPKMKLENLRVFDLIMENGIPTNQNHGVYLFFSKDNQCLYVGKNSSNTFVERIPSHFALDERSWMNYFLKHFKKAHKIESIPETATRVTQCNLLLLSVDERDIEWIDALEKAMRIVMRPLFNDLSEKYLHRNKPIKPTQKVWRLLRRL